MGIELVALYLVLTVLILPQVPAILKLASTLISKLYDGIRFILSPIFNEKEQSRESMNPKAPIKNKEENSNSKKTKNDKSESKRQSETVSEKKINKANEKLIKPKKTISKSSRKKRVRTKQ